MPSASATTSQTFSMSTLPGRAGSAAPAPVATLVRRIESAWRAIACRSDERRTVAHLRSLTDAQLRDLGIARADILRIVCGRPDGPA